MQTLGAPGSAVDTAADEDGSSFPSAFVTFFHKSLCLCITGVCGM